MKKLGWIALGFFAAALVLGGSVGAAVGSDPRKVEEIVIGGGVSESVNGGAEIDKSGNMDTSGYVSGASVKLRQGNYRATITAPTLTANRSQTVPNQDGEFSMIGQTVSGGPGGEIEDGTITSDDLAANAVSGSNITDGSIETADLADNSVTSAKIVNAAILAEDLASNSVTSAKITDGTIATADMADAAVTSDKIADGSVGTTKIAADAVTSAKIPDGAVGTTEIAADAVTSAKIPADAIGASEIAGDAVGTSEIAADAVGASEIATDAVGAAEIAADAVTASEIATDAVGAAEIAAGAVGTSEVADGSLTNTDISASAAIAVSKLAAGPESYILKTVSGVPAWAAESGGSGTVSGPGPLVDNAIPRMNGTGGVTLQGYSSNTPTIGDDGAFAFSNGGTVLGEMYVGDGSNAGYVNIRTPGSINLYRGAGSTKRGGLGLFTDTESGSFGGNGLVYQVYDNTGSYSHNALILQNNPASGMQLAGIGGVPREIYLDANGDGTTDSQVTAAGKVRLEALAQGGATTGQTLAWNGSTYAPSSSGTGNVSNSGAGTDNSVARFNGGGTAIQESLVIIGDTGDVTGVKSLMTTGTITAPAATTSIASLNIPHGTAPSAPTNGDVWTTTSGPYWRVNGTTEKVPMLDQAETITGNWVNTANPWADNEVADGLTISGGTVNNTVIGGTSAAAATFTTVTGTTGTWTGKHTHTVSGYPTVEWRRGLSSAGAGVGVDGYLWKADNTTYFNYASIAPQIKSSTASSESGQISFFCAQGGTAATSLGAAMLLDNTGMVFEGTSNDANETTISLTNPTADRTFTIPDRDSITAMTTGLVRFGAAEMTPQGYGAVYTACDAYANISGSIMWGMPCLDGVLDAMQMQTVMPNDYNAGTVVVSVYWVTTSSSTNNAQWGCLIGTASSGQDISDATDDYLADPDVGHKVTANAGALKINKTTFSAVSPDHPAAGVPLVVFIGRVADTFFDSGNLDTLAATAYVVAVEVSYTRK